MSRSYKKHPHCHVCKKDSKMKKVFSRKIRRTTKNDYIPNGNHYKKMNCSWEICDFEDHGTTYEQFVNAFDKREDNEETKNLYNKYYLRK